MSGNTKAIGAAYSDQNLDGSPGGATMSNYAIIASTISASTITSPTVSTPTITSPTITGAVTIGANATNTVGFFGAPVTIQPTATQEASVSTSVAVSISATQWGFTTSTQANAIVTLVNQLRADLVSLGIIKGA